jgi:chemotaxis protein CheD
MGEISVRMGELATSADPETALVSIGLGSCIGLALVDAASRVAGLAHVMLPGPGAADSRPPATFADTGVPALLDAVLAAGARRMSLSAIIVGGAQMFGGAGRMQVGQRNEEAVREALRAARLPVARAETGGSSGRTIRIYLDDVRVTSREAGGSEQILFGAGPIAVAA